MTGIEMAGIALAVVPLCIYVLEHHEDELRPFRALWRYRKQYKRSIEDLGLCLVQLEDTISSVLRDAGISDDGRGIQALVQAYDPGVWNDDDQEAKLIAHFGRTTYEHGFEVKLRRIRDGIMKVSWILGLEKLGLCGGDDEIWSRIKDSKDKQDAPCDPNSSSQTKHVLKSRAKLVFGSMSIDKHLESLDKNIQWLARTAESAEKRTSAATKTLGPTSMRRAPAFHPSLQEIAKHAQRIHLALQDVWSCSQHDCHHVHLRLDQRLKSRDTSGCSRPGGLASFTLKYAPSTDTDTWDKIEICVPEQVDATTPGSNSNTRKTRFSLNPGPGPASTASISLQERAVRDLCTSATRHQASLSKFYLNQNNEIVGRIGGSEGTLPGLKPMRRVSFKSLFHESSNTSKLGTLLTTEQSISLGSTIVSTALQLSSTVWLAEKWSAEDLFFIKANGTIDTNETYVTIAYRSTNPGTLPDTQLLKSDGTFFVRLGVMLLEIWAQTTIEDLRLQDPTLIDPNTFKGPWHDVATIKEYMQRTRGTMQPCFVEAINYCMSAFAQGVADARDAKTRAQMAKEVLHHFEVELQYWRARK